MSGDPKVLVLKYLHDQNRPYSTNDILLNLHKEHGKTAIQKAIDMLVVEGKVTEKVNGKQKAYVINQSDMPTANPQELSSLDQQILDLQDKTQKLQEDLKSKETLLKSLTSQLTTKQGASEIVKLNAEVAKLETKLKSFESQGNLITKEDKIKVEKKHEAAVKEWRKRKRMCTNIIDAILESYPKSKKALLEEIGIETDEDLGIKIPDI